MIAIWDEKTIKYAKVIVAILTAVAASLTTVVATLASLDIDVSTIMIVMTVVDGLAAAVAAFFGLKKSQLIEAQKAEIAAMHAEVATITNVKRGANVELTESEDSKAARVVQPGLTFETECTEPTCKCRFKYQSKHIVSYEGVKTVQCPVCNSICPATCVEQR